MVLLVWRWLKADIDRHGEARQASHYLQICSDQQSVSFVFARSASASRVYAWAASSGAFRTIAIIFRVKLLFFSVLRKHIQRYFKIHTVLRWEISMKKIRDSQNGRYHVKNQYYLNKLQDKKTDSYLKWNFIPKSNAWELQFIKSALAARYCFTT